MERDQLWQAVLGELELSLSKANFTTWFKNTFVDVCDESSVTVACPNTFTMSWLDQKYHKEIARALQNVTGSAVLKVSFRVATRRSVDAAHTQQAVIAAQKATQQQPSGTARIDAVIAPSQLSPAGLNPKYTFDNFIVGKNNELARAACMAVVKSPGTVYNPLFIYGGVGLGKTHIMQAVGHEIQQRYPKARVVYVTSERFTNEFIKSVQEGQSENFKKRYRTVDVLLIDDIQFISGKEGTQEEFFHTFNTLHQADKQIILTSDRPPKAIPALEDRLVSRFQWGMIADISVPEFETRMAIIERKCQEAGVQFQEDVLHYIAENIQSNIRELEGALNKLTAYRDLKQITIGLEQAKEILGSTVNQGHKGAITPRRIIEVVSGFFEISIEDIVGGSRKKELVIPRQIAMYLMREEMSSSYPSIGREFGGRDHTTAMHACTKMEEYTQKDERIKQDIISLRQKIYHS